MKTYITLDDLMDFEVWKAWKNGKLELEPLYTEEEIRRMLSHDGDAFGPGN
jgi:hypothetical protein